MVHKYFSKNRINFSLTALLMWGFFIYRQTILSLHILSRTKMKKLIYDIGMYDGSDTRYYLNEGFRVLAIEENPVLVKRARELIFQEEMDVSF